MISVFFFSQSVSRELGVGTKTFFFSPLSDNWVVLICLFSVDAHTLASFISLE